MALPAILALAVGLGMDAMSVSMAIGVRWHGPRQHFRLAFHMGLFQFLMPVIGYFAGVQLAGLLAAVGRFIAAGLVIAVGIKMLFEALRSHPGAVAESVEHLAEKELPALRDPTRGWSLIGLSLATSIDALVVGLSLGLRGGDIWLASLVIGLVAAAMVLVGVSVGKFAGKAAGKPAEFVGAVVLVALGLVFLVT